MADMLMATVPQARFTVLVDIKTPSTELIGAKYRNRVYSLGKELVGGVSQLQSYCRAWVVEGSRQEDTIAELECPTPIRWSSFYENPATSKRSNGRINF